jgi:hypothetical protein
MPAEGCHYPQRIPCGLPRFLNHVDYAKSSEVICDNLIKLILFLLAMNFYVVDEERPYEDGTCHAKTTDVPHQP